MDTAPAPVTPQERRAALVEHQRVALDAYERGDETTLRQKIDTLVAWRARPLVEGLRRLSRELGDALGNLPAPESASADGVPTSFLVVGGSGQSASRRSKHIATRSAERDRSAPTSRRWDSVRHSPGRTQGMSSDAMVSWSRRSSSSIRARRRSRGAKARGCINTSKRSF